MRIGRALSLDKPADVPDVVEVRDVWDEEEEDRVESWDVVVSEDMTFVDKALSYLTDPAAFI